MLQDLPYLALFPASAAVMRAESGGLLRPGTAALRAERAGLRLLRVPEGRPDHLRGDQAHRHRLDISRSDIGYAGLKDRDATSRDALQRPADGGHHRGTRDHHAGRGPGRTPRWADLHDNKLKMGHIGRNRSCYARLREVTATDVVEPADPRPPRKVGLPNYFGEQRFGRDDARPSSASSCSAVVPGVPRPLPPPVVANARKIYETDGPAAALNSFAQQHPVGAESSRQQHRRR